VSLKVLATAGREEVAVVYLAQTQGGQAVEFVESVQPPWPREKKWVLIVSTLCGSPVGCLMCDAGSYYRGKLSRTDILAQIDFLVRKRYREGSIPAKKFKIQFARTGEPAFNLNVLEVLEELPYCYKAPGLLPSISTFAPAGTNKFFERLMEIKEKEYSRGRFQLQFSIHTTNEKLRDRLIPVKKWSLAHIKEYGEEFYKTGDRKITLNFALIQDMPVDSRVLLRHFDPDKFLIKITPLNPTYQAVKNGLKSYVDPQQKKEYYPVLEELRAGGYEVILSIGEVEENFIGSNCGQYVTKHLKTEKPIRDGYTYPVQEHSAASSACIQAGID